MHVILIRLFMNAINNLVAHGCAGELLSFEFSLFLSFANALFCTSTLSGLSFT